MSRSPELYLADIFEAGQAIQGYLKGVSFKQFCTDRMRQSAVIREIEIIGEAVGKLPDKLKQSAPSVAWQDIKDFRNLLAMNISVSTWSGARGHISTINYS